MVGLVDSGSEREEATEKEHEMVGGGGGAASDIPVGAVGPGVPPHLAALDKGGIQSQLFASCS